MDSNCTIHWREAKPNWNRPSKTLLHLVHYLWMQVRNKTPILKPRLLSLQKLNISNWIRTNKWLSVWKSRPFRKPLHCNWVCQHVWSWNPLVSCSFRSDWIGSTFSSSSTCFSIWEWLHLLAWFWVFITHWEKYRDCSRYLVARIWKNWRISELRIWNNKSTSFYGLVLWDSWKLCK